MRWYHKHPAPPASSSIDLIIARCTIAGHHFSVQLANFYSHTFPNYLHNFFIMSNKNNNVGRDELAALLGASRASDLVAAASDSNKSAIGDGLAQQSRRHANKNNDAEDVSRMDRAQAAALVAKQFGSGTQSSTATVSRHRAAGKRKRQYQLLAGDYAAEGNNSANNAVISSIEGEEDNVDVYDKNTEQQEEDKFAISKSNASGGKRKKLEAKVLLKRGGEQNNERRRRRRSHSDSSNSSSSSSHSSSSSDESSRKGSSRRKHRHRSNSSSSSSEDEADLRRKRAREKAQRNRSEAVVVSVRGTNEHITNNNDKVQQRRDEKLGTLNDSKRGDSNENTSGTKIQHEIDTNKTNKMGETVPKRKRQNTSSGTSGSSSSSSSSSTSSSSESDSDSDHNVAPMSVSKPLFVPKSKRGTVAEVEAQQQKLEEAEERRMKEKEKRAVQSRALVAEAVSAAGKNGESGNGLDDGDEFETGEVGGEFIPVPDDSDPTDEDSPELVLAERDAWEVRELIRILRDVDAAVELEKERKELERRRALTDEERLEEDKRSGRYRAPGRRRRDDDRHGGGSKSDINYLQRYHHRGAFYMDEDTLDQAGENDVRHRAAEYSRAATGEDRIDKRSLPEVLQRKKFGFAGYSTKYKGLAKEDTTDKSLDFLPIKSTTRDSNR